MGKYMVKLRETGEDTDKGILARTAFDRIVFSDVLIAATPGNQVL